jgi:hypothetical protein
VRVNPFVIQFDLNLLQKPVKINKKEKKPWILGKMFEIRFLHVSGGQEGLEGRVSPRTGASEWIALAHYAGTRPGCVGRTTVVLPVRWNEGLRYVFLMEPVRVHLRVLGGSPLHGSDTLGFTDGDHPWNLSLGTLVRCPRSSRPWTVCALFKFRQPVDL